LQISSLAQLASQQQLFDAKISEQKALIKDFKMQCEQKAAQMIQISQDEVAIPRAELAKMKATLHRLKWQRQRQQCRLAKLKKEKTAIQARTLINHKLRERIKTVREEISSDESKLASIASENGIAQDNEITALAEMLQALIAKSRKKKRETRQIRDEAIALKCKARQLDEDLRLAESVIRTQQQERAKIVARFPAGANGRDFQIP
jgi:chromosome segregation ATPase